MAQFKLSSSEIPQIIVLMEQMFPGLDLGAMTKALDGVTADTSNNALNLNKKLPATGKLPAASVSLSLTLTKD